MAEVVVFSVYLKGEVWDDSSISIVLLLNFVHWPLNIKQIILELHYNTLNCRDEFRVNSVLDLRKEI